MSETIFSPCRKYRYSLTRVLAPMAEPQRACLFVMLNPSTADENTDDPTIRRCIGFATAWGYSRLDVVNLFALRATDPAALLSASDPVGFDNDRYIEFYARSAAMIVCAWGAHGVLNGRALRVTKILHDAGFALKCLGLTGSGQPRHPLYLPAKTQPEVFC